ncbi:MAG TPA: Bax inhibitor-1/YccA family protein [Longimicrobiales bacterium]|nr:Bax inhibitor-1/YccA family protein [Longimicrobiales bacterium]
MNPLFTLPVFAKERADLATIRPMTVEGSALKALLLVGLGLGGLVIGYARAVEAGPRGSLLPWLLCLAAAVLLALGARSLTRAAPLLGPGQALLQGLGLGGLAGALVPIAGAAPLHAAGVSLATVFALLFASNAGLLGRGRARAWAAVLVGGLLFAQVLVMLLEFFGLAVPLLPALPAWGVVLACAAGALLTTLLLRDVDALELEAERGAPPHMEWYAAQGLLAQALWLWIQPLVLAVALALRSAAWLRARRPAPRPEPRRERAQQPARQRDTALDPTAG